MPLIDSEPDALANLYAASLFELSEAQGGHDLVEQITGELTDLVELTRSDPALGEFFASRIVPMEKRAASIRRIFEGRVHDLTLRFLLVLNDKGRMAHLLPIVASFDQLAQGAFGRVEVDVYTAQPLEAGALEMIRERLRAALGKEPVVHPYTDPSMIGGLRLQIGDRLLDASISTRLRRMRQQLTQSGAASVRERFDQMVEGGIEGVDE